MLSTSSPKEEVLLKKEVDFLLPLTASVNGPSQIRCVKYFESLLHTPYKVVKKVLKQVKLKPVPDIVGFTPSVEVVSCATIPFQTLYKSSFKYEIMKLLRRKTHCCFLCVREENEIAKQFRFLLSHTRSNNASFSPRSHLIIF